MILRGMAKAGVPPGEQSLASTMEAFASKGDVDRVLSLAKVGVGTNYNTTSFFLCFLGGGRAERHHCGYPAAHIVFACSIHAGPLWPKVLLQSCFRPTLHCCVFAADAWIAVVTWLLFGTRTPVSLC